MAPNGTHIVRNAALRYGLYTAVLAGGIGLSSFLIQQVGGYEIMRENGPVEWTQFVWLILSSALFYLAARAGKRYRELFHVLLIMPMIAATRELDNLLDVQIYRGTWEAVGGGFFCRLRLRQDNRPAIALANPVEGESSQGRRRLCRRNTGASGVYDHLYRGFREPPAL